MRRWIAAGILLVLMISLAGCGTTVGTGGLNMPENTGMNVTVQTRYEPNPAVPGEQTNLLVNLQTFNPPINTEETEADPQTEFVSTRNLADEYMMIYPNVSLTFTNCYSSTDTATQIEEQTVLISAEQAPDLFFCWGNALASTGWLKVITEYLFEPNYYEPENESWHDMFMDDLWNGQMAMDGDDIIGVPFTCHTPGTIGVWYNEELFQEYGVEQPTTWQEMMDAALLFKSEGLVGFAPWTGNREITTSAWDFWSVLRPSLSAGYEKWDEDASGYVNWDEFIRSYVEGAHYTQNNPNVQAMFKLYKYKYTVICDPDMASADYESAWAEGRVAMLEDGLWRVPNEESNPNRHFEYGLSLHPMVSDDTRFSLDDGTVELDSSLIRTQDMTDSGPQNLSLSIVYSVMDPEQQNHSDLVVPVAVDFLQYLTATENLDQMIAEKNGAMLGATKTCAVPDSLREWMSQPFAKNQAGEIDIAGFGVGDTAEVRKQLLVQYVNDQITEAEFFRAWDQECYANLHEYVEAANYDISAFEEFVPEGC